MVRREAVVAVAIVVAAVVAGCRPPAPAEGGRPGAGAVGPEVEATVLTIRESYHPPTRAMLHRILVFDSKVRMTDEVDRWRLFDLDAKSVTWVNEIAGTHRTIGLDELVRIRERQLRAPLPAQVAPMEVRRTGRTMDIAGHRAEQWVMELGGYRRELWLSRDPLVAPEFFRMWFASNPVSEPWAGVMRQSRALLQLEGFPLWDRSVLVWKDGAKDGVMISQRRLVSVERKRVPRSLFELPAASRDASPPVIRSGGGRRSVS